MGGGAADRQSPGRAAGGARVTGRRVVVTGGAGFIGSHVVEALAAEGWRVGVVDDLSRGRAQYVPPEAELVVAPVQGERAARFVESFRPQAVVHLAAQVSVARSAEDPPGDAQANVLGTIAVAQACARAGVRRLITVSSAAVYGSPRCLPVGEDHPLEPLSPYGVSKLAAEHYTRVLAEQAGLEWCVLRYANVYGPRQDAQAEAGVVAAFAGAALRGEPLTVHGDGRQTRDFVYVGDVAEATLRALSVPGAGGRVLNVGTETEVSILELAEAIWRAAGRTGEVPRVHTAPRPGDIRRSVLACGQAARVLGFRASVPLPEGLSRTLREGRL